MRDYYKKVYIKLPKNIFRIMIFKFNIHMYIFIHINFLLEGHTEDFFGNFFGLVPNIQRFSKKEHTVQIIYLLVTSVIRSLISFLLLLLLKTIILNGK
uniref:Uncharacterized protein n=1 Tax=Meloidogyne enterolobii TaxID=390850 RepID=A0A6V7XEE2_MELEN|nr:unnamed protein product [Meloidogyne enterolobii]